MNEKNEKKKVKSARENDEAISEGFQFFFLGVVWTEENGNGLCAVQRRVWVEQKKKQTTTTTTTSTDVG